MFGELNNAQIMKEEVKGIIKVMKVRKVSGLDGCVVECLESSNACVVECLMFVKYLFCDQYVTS